MSGGKSDSSALRGSRHGHGQDGSGRLCRWGPSLPLPVPLLPLPSASWRGSRHLSHSSHSSFPPCSFLFSLFPPPRLPQLSTQWIRVFPSQSRAPGHVHTPGPLPESGPAPRGRTPFHSFGLFRAASSGAGREGEHQRIKSTRNFHLPTQLETKEAIVRANSRH